VTTLCIRLGGHLLAVDATCVEGVGDGAVLVDQVCDVVEVASSRREPVPTTLNSETRSVVVGAYRLDRGLVLEIDTRLLVDNVTREDWTEKP